MKTKILDFIKKNNFILLVLSLCALSLISVASSLAYTIILYLALICSVIFYGLSESLIVWLVCVFFEGANSVLGLPMLAVVLAFFVIKTFIQNKCKITKDVIIAGIITIVLIVWTFAVNPQRQYLKEALSYAVVAVIAFEFYYLRHKFEFEKIVKFGTMILILSCAISLIFFLINPDLAGFKIDWKNVKRFCALTSHENMLATYAVMFMSFNVLLFFKGKLKIWYFAACELILFVVGFMTMSKAFLMFFVVMAVLYFIESFKKNKKYAFYQLAAVIVFIGVFAGIFNKRIVSLVDRFFSPDSGYSVMDVLTSGRNGIWRNYFYLWGTSALTVLFGLGACYNPYYYVHNFYLDFLFKYGIFGFMLIAFLVFYYLKNASKGYKPNFVNYIPVVIIALNLAVEVFIAKRIIVLFIALMGLFYLCEREEHSQEKNEETSNATESSENLDKEKKDTKPIPKILHYVWLGGKSLPEKNAKLIETWKKNCPDYKIMVWNEENFDISKSNKYVKEAYENKKFAFASDYIRLYALYNYGGIYLDTDVEVLKSFDELLDNEMFVCRENVAFISTAVIGAKKKNKIIGDLLKSYEDRVFVKEDGAFDITTNVENISLYLHKKFNYPLSTETFKCDEISIYESTYFSPKDYFSGKMKDTKNSFAIHHFEGTWDTKGKSPAKKMAKSIFKILPKGLVFFIIDTYKKHQLKSKEN